MVAWFVKGPVFHSVNSEPDRTVDQIPLEACNLYGTVMDPPFIILNSSFSLLTSMTTMLESTPSRLYNLLYFHVS